MGELSANVRTQASTSYVFRVRGVAGGLVSLGFATVEVTTPPREPSVVYLAVPRPVPDGPTTLTFRVEGTQTLQPTSGTLEVSINGGRPRRWPWSRARPSCRWTSLLEPTT
jgi:hypothetical protein